MHYQQPLVASAVSWVDDWLKDSGGNIPLYPSPTSLTRSVTGIPAYAYSDPRGTNMKNSDKNSLVLVRDTPICSNSLSGKCGKPRIKHHSSAVCFSFIIMGGRSICTERAYLKYMAWLSRYQYVYT